VDNPIVLIVDDNEMTRRLVRAALAGEGWTILEAADGWTALDVASRQRPDLVLQDLFLPDFDGLALLDRLRALPGTADLPVVAYSGWLSRLDELRRSRVGFTDYLPKPVELSRLCETVRSHLSG
jgi:two-component system KDP operon response regulator KdpE